MSRVVAAVAAGFLFAACNQPLPSTVPADGTVPPDRAELRPIRLEEKHGTGVGSVDVTTASLDYVRARRALLGLGDRDDLEVIATRKGPAGLNHVRLQQTYEGIPVWGADVVVHSSDTTFKSLAGNLTVGLKDLDTAPAIDAGTALFSAKGDYATKGKGTEALAFEREATTLVVFPTGGAGAKLAWHVEFFTELQNGIEPGLWHYMIDAKTGAILDKWNGIHTLSQASGPGGNAKVSRTWSNALDVELASGSTYKADTSRLLTVNMNNSQSGSGTVATGSLSNFGDAAINDAHGFAEVTLNMLQQWMGYNSIDNAGFRIRSRVHYGTNYENAFWDGTQMTYGDGASYFYPLSGDIDVVSHEIHHGFTSKHSNLTYSGQSGGINESFSDIAGTAAEFFHEGTGADWDVGRDIFKQNGALRYMCTPSQDGSSIDHASQYTNGMGVHFSSGVFNRAFCRMARRFSSGSPTGNANPDGVRRAAKAFYEANDNYWTSSTNFTQGCQGVYDAASALGYSATELQHIRDSFADVGVYCGGATQPPPSCDQTLTAASGTITSPNYPSNYPNNVKRTWCIQPASAATLTFSAFDTESGYDFVTIRDANGQQLSKTSGATKPAAATSTKLYVTFESDGSVVKTGWSASWTSGGASNQAPSVSLTSPANGATVSGMVTVSADASDADGSVAKVVFGLPNGTTVEDTTAPYSIQWDSTTVADGSSKTITAKAVDNMGAQSATASRVVSVQNGSSCVNGTFDASGLPMSIPDNNATGITSNLAVSGAGNVASLAVSASISHPYKGDLVVTLIAPDGTQHVLHNRSGGSADNVVLSNVPVTTFNGKVAAGTWKLRVQDRAAADVGSLQSWSLSISGDCTGNVPSGWSASGSPNLATVDNGQVCTTLTVSGAGNAADVKLDLSGTHDYRSILRATLSHGGVTREAFPTGTFPSGAGNFGLTGRAISGFTGDAAGDWTLCIVDTDAYGDTGVLASWSVHN